MQLIKYYQTAFKEAKLPSWLFTYTILSTSQSTGLIELIPDAISLDGLKKKDAYPGSLRAYFEMTYGGSIMQTPPTVTADNSNTASSSSSPALRTAIDNFIASMAAYSIVTYLLGIKDR